MDRYGFALKILVQIRVAEQIVRPVIHGVQKRIRTILVLQVMPEDEMQDASCSEKVIQDLHDYMFKNHAQIDEKLCLDGFALSIY